MNERDVFIEVGKCSRPSWRKGRKEGRKEGRKARAALLDGIGKSVDDVIRYYRI